MKQFFFSRTGQVIVHLSVLGFASFVTVASGGAMLPVVAAGLSAAVGVIWQSSNTNGTPQSTPFPPSTTTTTTTKSNTTKAVTN